jgi:[ribosomal protein S18]-alanine N-acetyltransferase
VSAWSKPDSHLGFRAEVLPAPEAQIGPILLRRAQTADLERISTIENAAYAFPWSHGNFVDSHASGYDFWVLEQAGLLVGYALVMWLPDEAHLLNITIKPELQGQGLGRAFLHWIFDDTCRRGARSLMLEVRPSNTRAFALYSKLDFLEIGRRKDYYPSWNQSREDAIVLSKRLDQKNS